MAVVEERPTEEDIDLALDIIERNDTAAWERITADLNDAHDAEDMERYDQIAMDAITYAIAIQRKAAYVPPKTKATQAKRQTNKPAMKATRSRPGPTPAHLVTADQLSKAEPALYRIIAAGLWIFSTCGNVIAFAGGWSTMEWFTRPFWIALVASLAWQGACTAAQFITCRYWYNPVYILALIASFVPAYIGYRSLIAVPLSQWFAGVSQDVFASVDTLKGFDSSVIVKTLVIHAVFAVGLIAVDVIPEKIFVKK